MKQEREDEVFASLTSILETTPKDVIALLNLSVFVTGQGEVEKALKLKEKALSLDPNCIEKFNENSIFPESSSQVSAEEIDWLMKALKETEKSKLKPKT